MKRHKTKLIVIMIIAILTVATVKYVLYLVDKPIAGKTAQVYAMDDKTFALYLLSGRQDFKLGEAVSFAFQYNQEKSGIGKFFTALKNSLSKSQEELKIKTTVYDYKGEETGLFKAQVEQQANGQFAVELEQDSSIKKPGKFTMAIEVEDPAVDSGKAAQFSYDFRYGVLGINTNKSIYLPGETAYLQMAALKDDGHTLCNANLELEITDPAGQVSKPEVVRSGKCHGDNVVDVPDYFAYYQVNGVDQYQMKLTNLDNGYYITDTFEVRESIAFDVERIGPTRIYPPADYQMKFNIKANQEFQGDIIETVPNVFAVQGGTGGYLIEQQDNYYNNLVWRNISLETGDLFQPSYSFRVPNISPYFYELGPLTFISNSTAAYQRDPIARLASQAKQATLQDDRGRTRDDIAFQEARKWMIAADANITYGSADEFAADQITHLRSAELDTDKFVICYADNEVGFCRVGSVSGTTINSWGTAVSFSSDCIRNIASLGVAKLDTDKFAVCYTDDVYADDGFCRASYVSGTTISGFGTAVEFSGDGDAEHINAVGLSEDKWVVAYNDETASDDLYAVIGTTGDTDTTISYGAERQMSTNLGAEIGLAKLSSIKFVITYNIGGVTQSNAIVGTVSGTTITPGNDYVVEYVNTNMTNSACSPQDEDRFVNAYRDGINLEGNVVAGTVSGTIISLGSIVDFNPNLAEIYFPDCVFTDATHFVIAYEDVGNSQYGTWVYCEVDWSDKSISCNSDEVFASYQIGALDANLNEREFRGIELLDGYASAAKIMVGFVDVDSSTYDGMAIIGDITVCGNGHREGSEGCDDGDTTGGDGCSATCTVEDGCSCSGSDPDVCSCAAPVATSTRAIYRSVGPGKTTALTSGGGSNSLIIAGSTATFNVALPNNVGVGDALQYDSDSKIAFIHKRISATQYDVKTATGTTPIAVAGDTAWDIFRAYTALSNAETGSENPGIADGVENFDTWSGGRDITDSANAEVWNIACYGDATDATSTSIVWDDWTTDTDNYIRIFTPYKTSEVGTSQRHNGVWDTSKYHLYLTAADFYIYDDYLRIEGLQIEASTTVSIHSAINVNNIASTNDIRINNNLIRLSSSPGAELGIWIVDADTNVKIWNNIIYSIASNLNNGIALNASTGYLYNNTVVGMDGYNYGRFTGTVIAINNISQGCSDGFNGTFDPSSDYNLSDIAGDAPGVNLYNGVTVQFADAANYDYHLAYSDIAAKDKGIGLAFEEFSDWYFNDDIDNATRGNRWDIGADEYTGGKLMIDPNASGRIYVNTSLVDFATDGLVGHWTFNGQDMDWSTNTAFDRSGQGNNGTLYNMSTSSSPIAGASGQGLYFDGVDDYVDCGDIDAMDGATYLTIEAWVKPNTLINDAGVIDKYSFPDMTTMALGNASYGGNNDVQIYLASDGNSALYERGYTTGNIISANTWNHWAMVFNGTGATDADKLKFYFNGEVQPLSFVGVIPATTDNNSSNFKIGFNNQGGVVYFDGTIDEVRVYSRALSASEVQQLYEIGKIRF